MKWFSPFLFNNSNIFIFLYSYANISMLQTSSKKKNRLIMSLQLFQHLVIHPIYLLNLYRYFFPSFQPIFLNHFDMITLLKFCLQIIDLVMLQKSISKKPSMIFCERCDICYKEYDLNINKPLIICQANHCICKVCLIAIRQKPLCPFCRKTVSYQRIRLNYTTVRKITKKTLNINPQIDLNSSRVKQAVLKDQNIDEIEQNDLANVFLDASEFIEEGEQNAQGNEGQSGVRCSLFLISLYVYFVFLQLPLGGINIYNGFNLDKNQCSFNQMTELHSQLGLSYKSLGGIQVILSLHFLYLRYLYKMKKVSQIGQLLFDIILSFFVILKSTISIVIFIKFLHEKSLSLCIPQVYQFMVVNLFVNYIAILIGLNIILRLCCLLQNNH